MSNMLGSKNHGPQCDCSAPVESHEKCSKKESNGRSRSREKRSWKNSVDNH